MSRRLVLAVVVSLALVVAACGQKKGVHVAASNGGGFSSGTGGAADNGQPAAGDAGTATGGGSATGAGSTATGGGGAATGGGATATGGGATSGGTASASGGSTASGPVDRTGVSDTEIRIGIHAPLSGAGVPAPQFNLGKDVYFNYIKSKGGINGRNVTVFIEDDGYNPSQAVAACKKLVEQDHVFLLFGGGGTDQIVQCAQYAASVGVPYVAEGVTELGFSKYPAYFAESMTYPAQSALLASYIKNVAQKTNVVMVRADTTNFNDSETSFTNAAKQAGLTVKPTIKISKDATAADASTAAQQMCTSTPTPGAADLAVFPLMSPKIFIELAGAAAQQQCFPRYAGIGITLGLNAVTQGTCTSQALKNGATFFSPFPGLDKIDSMDPAYQQAYQSENHANGDDIGLALWGGEKLLAAQLMAAGKDLSRQSFVAAVNGKTFSTGVYPDANFSKSHFGGTAVHVLVANCSKNAYDTQSTFKNSF
jgi:branched-chain amino acid transport system substrate-binding protein